ncbi:MAG: DOMON-like domain-containing protein [Erythrobacter sp.]|uniref:DOMON-like domain-containing protein n=1 Tax=Erythrobacter sp. TaxID=1042 RepID=UPI0032EC63DF
MIPLMLHRTCDLGPVRAVTARIRATEIGCEAEFRLDGTLEGVVLPPAGPAIRTDGLWRSTCFEVFWQSIGEEGYREFNFAPSGQWAAYAFDRHRDGMREAPVEGISVSASHASSQGTGGMVLTASLAADLAAPAQVGLSAVIEQAGGGLQYWALAFPPGPPDFHSEACRQVIVER